MAIRKFTQFLNEMQEGSHMMNELKRAMKKKQIAHEKNVTEMMEEIVMEAYSDGMIDDEEMEQIEELSEMMKETYGNMVKEGMMHAMNKMQSRKTK